MKRFFESPPPLDADERILQAASMALAENRRAHFRRRLLQWLAVPAAATAAFALFFKFGQDRVDEIAEFEDWQDVTEDDFEIVSELEVIDELDVLDEWEDA